MDDNTKQFGFLAAFILTLWVFGSLFFICELGERVTFNIQLFGNELDQCNWLRLSMEMQRMYLIFLADTQQLEYISCYFNICCTRETFKKVSLATQIPHFNAEFNNFKIKF